VIRAGYELLHLITYFTVGPKEDARLDHPQGRQGTAGGRRHPHRFRTRLHPRPDHRYNDFITLGGEVGGQGSRQGARRRQGICRPGRRRPAVQVQPTLTFPNHYTLVTGLRPDRHGIVSNTLYDPRRPGTRFQSKELESSDPFWWAEAEPIWITAEKHGVRAGTMFWPGQEAPHEGLRASDWARFDPNFTDEQRVRTVMDWMRRPAAIRPAFVTIYFDLIDRTSHRKRPEERRDDRRRARDRRADRHA
jgi:hypothetical protein